MRPAVRDRLVMPILLPLGILAVIAAVLFGFSRIQLSLTPTAATVTAIVVATGIVVTASVAAGRKQVRLSTLGAMLGVTAGVAMLAGLALLQPTRVVRVEAHHTPRAGRAPPTALVVVG